MAYFDSGGIKPANFEFRIILLSEKPVLIPITLQVHEKHHSHSNLYHEYSGKNINILYLLHANEGDTDVFF